MEYLPSTPGFSREQDPQVPADPEPQDMSVSCCHVAVIPRCSFPPVSADGVRCPPSISAVDTAPGTVKGGPPLSHEECWRSSQRSHNSLPQLLAYGYWGHRTSVKGAPTQLASVCRKIWPGSVPALVRSSQTGRHAAAPTVAGLASNRSVGIRPRQCRGTRPTKI